MNRGYYMAGILLIAVVIAATLVAWPHLASSVPTHWDIHGRPSGYTPKRGLFLIPVIMAGIMLLTAALPWFSPKHFGVGGFRGTYLQIMLMILALIAYIHGVTLWIGTGHHVDSGRAVIGGVCVFFIFLGNVTGKIRRNFYLGIRTPWALASERVWTATHRFAARTMVIAGLAGVALTALNLEIWTFASIMAGALAPAVYSLWFYKQLERRGEL